MSQGDKNQPTNFGGSPESAIAAAKARRVPVGGVPMPTMPRLDQPPPPSSTGVQQVRSVQAAQRILTPQQQETLKQRGQFVGGVGSAYAANQPGANQLPTDTEGNEQPIDPRLAPRPEGAGLRPETVRDLEAVAQANAPTEDDEALKKINSDIEEMDDVYEDNEFGERVKSLLENKKRKEAIENRCQPLAFEELLLNGSVQQKVPIIPGKFEPTFRSLQGDENIEVLRLMGPVKGPQQYILDTLALYNLTCGLYAINNKIMINHFNKDGDFDETLFLKKYKVVSKLSIPIIADLVVNFRWFSRRVQKLTVVDDIKGF